MPDQLKWSKLDPMNILKVQTDTPWQLIEKLKENKTKYTPASGTVALDNTNILKRKADDIYQINLIQNKRPRTSLDIQTQNESPVGLIWDSHDYSCAYDSVFTVLGDIWVYDPTMWSHEFSLISSFASKLALGFEKVSLKKKNLEDIRNSIQKILYKKDSSAFPYGTSGVDISELLLRMFTGKSIGKILFNCTNCGASTTSATKITTLFTISVKNYTSIQEHINATARKTKKCSHCDENIFKTHKYNSPPCLRVISFSQQSQGVKISKSIMLETESGPITLNICGAICIEG